MLLTIIDAGAWHQMEYAGSLLPAFRACAHCWDAATIYDFNHTPFVNP